MWIAAGAVVLLVAIAVGWWILTPAKPKAPAPGNANDVAQVVAEVARHLVVNHQETPTIATVQDPVALRTQNPVFYRDAQVGDRLLIWSDQAVLYSPSRDVILSVLPVSQAQPNQANTTPSTTVASEKATIEVRNGSGVPGLGKTLADKLTAAGFTVLPTSNAKSQSYATTIIVKATDKPLPQTLATLETLIHAPIQTLPAGELKAKGDVLIIVGKDAQQ